MQPAPIPRFDDATPVGNGPDIAPRAAIAKDIATARSLARRTDAASAARLARGLLEIAVGAYWIEVAPSRPLRAPFASAASAPVAAPLADDVPAWVKRFGRAAARLAPPGTPSAHGGCRADHVVTKSDPSVEDWALRDPLPLRADRTSTSPVAREPMPRHLAFSPSCCGFSAELAPRGVAFSTAAELFPSSSKRTFQNTGRGRG